MNRPSIAFAVATLLLAGAAGAEDLQSVYDHALQADPTLQQAANQHLATREVRTQAVLAMLPLDANVSKDWAGISGGAHSSTALLGNLGLQVNLFSWSNWIALKQSNAFVAQGEANWAAAQEDLVARVAQQYFAVLAAGDTLAAQDAALRSAQRQLEQAERRFEVGLIAVTDVQIARAARDSSNAAVIAARRTLASAEEQLRAITGEKYRALARPGDDMPLLTPDPASEDAWVSTALSQNATLTASRLAADISHDDYLASIGGHLPQINASVSRSWEIQKSGSTSLTQPPAFAATNTTDVTWQVGVTVPVFSAGATQSRVRQAHYTYKAAQSGYERSLRQAEQQARDAYQGVISQIAQVSAFKQAVQSNQISLQATEAGYEVGTKTAIDVLTARQQLVQAQTSYAQARYGYLNNIVSLRQAAGNLDRATIAQINGWLVAASTPDPTLGTAPQGADAAPADAPAATDPAAPVAAPAAR